jgi:hypothetical protein
MTRVVAKKYASSRAKRELMIIVWPKIRPTSIPKYSKRAIIRGLSKKALSRGVKVYDFAREHIYEICGSEECLIPKL